MQLKGFLLNLEDVEDGADGRDQTHKDRDDEAKDNQGCDVASLLDELIHELARNVNTLAYQVSDTETITC